MLSGECVHCDYPWSFGWDEKDRGFYAAKCGACGKGFWIEFSRTGNSYDHDQFLTDFAIPDGRAEEANAAMENRLLHGLSIQQEADGITSTPSRLLQRAYNRIKELLMVVDGRHHEEGDGALLKEIGEVLTPTIPQHIRTTVQITTFNEMYSKIIKEGWMACFGCKRMYFPGTATHCKECSGALTPLDGMFTEPTDLADESDDSADESDDSADLYGIAVDAWHRYQGTKIVPPDFAEAVMDAVEAHRERDAPAAAAPAAASAAAAPAAAAPAAAAAAVVLYDPDDVTEGMVAIDPDAKRITLRVRMTWHCLRAYLREIYVVQKDLAHAEFPFDKYEDEQLREGWAIDDAP